MSLSLVVAVVDPRHPADELASQLTADGYELHEAHSSRHAVSLLASRYADLLILGTLERPSVALTLLRELREGTLGPHAWPELPAITLAPLVAGDRELDAPTRPAVTTICPQAPATCTCEPSCMRSHGARTA